MAKQLNIRNDEAHSLACEIAREMGRSTTAIVTEALREYRDRHLPQLEVPPEQAEENFRILMELAREAARHKRPGATSDHSDFYDENGLPI
jgi:hypothetical protein